MCVVKPHTAALGGVTNSIVTIQEVENDDVIAQYLVNHRFAV